MELNGKALADLKDDKTGQIVLKAGQQLPGFAMLKDDGYHDVRQLDLFRMLDGGGSANSEARYGRSFGDGCFSKLGMVVAREPARAL